MLLVHSEFCENSLPGYVVSGGRCVASLRPSKNAMHPNMSSSTSQSHQAGESEFQHMGLGEGGTNI